MCTSLNIMNVQLTDNIYYYILCKTNLFKRLTFTNRNKLLQQHTPTGILAFTNASCKCNPKLSPANPEVKTCRTCNLLLAQQLKIHDVQNANTPHKVYLVPFWVKVVINNLCLLLFTYAKKLTFCHL